MIQSKMKVFKHKPNLSLTAIFEQAQKSINSHQRLMKEMIQFYFEDRENFIIEFIQCLACCFRCEKHPSVEMALDFAAKYCIYQENILEKDEVLLEQIFQFIFQNHSRKNQTIRYRTCEFINRLLNEMGDQAVIDQTIFQKIGNTMLERLQDRIPSIRAQAVMALQRLQDPYDNNCSIVKAFMFHMEADPNPFVRGKLVKHIAVTSQTLPHILERIKDIQPVVRKAAYKTLSRLKIQRFTIKQRQFILGCGLKERQALVKDFVINNLLMTWFKQRNCSILELLKILVVETINPDHLKIILYELFKQQPLSSVIELVKELQTKEKIIPIKDLTPENVAFWSYVVQYLSSPNEENEKNEEKIFKILPELTRFTKYLKAFNIVLPEKHENKYIMKTLMKIATVYSLSDEMGREQLKQFCITLLTSDETDVSFIPLLVQQLQTTIPNAKDRLLVMAEIISDIREPLEVDPFEEKRIPEDDLEYVETQLANLKCGSQTLDCERELRKSPYILIKCLTIIIEFLKAPDISKIDATLLTLKDHFIVACCAEQNSRVLNLALDAMSMLCIWDVELAKEHFIKFCIQVSDEATSLSALDAVFDILLVHGLTPFSFGGDEDDDLSDSRSNEFSLNDFSKDDTLPTASMKQLVGLLVCLLKSTSTGNKVKVCQGLAKLLLCGHINSPFVLAHLTLTWFNPETEAEPLIRQPLGLFFGLFSSKRPNAGEIIVESLIPTLKAIHQSDPEEHWGKIDPSGVIKLIVNLVRHDVAPESPSYEEKGSYHYRIAKLICQELIDEDSSKWVLGRALLMLELQSCDSRFASDLLLLLNRAMRIVRKIDKRAYKVLESFKAKVEENKESYQPNITEKSKNKYKKNSEDKENSNEEVTGKRQRLGRPAKGKKNQEDIKEETEETSDESENDEVDVKVNLHKIEDRNEDSKSSESVSRGSTSVDLPKETCISIAHTVKDEESEEKQIFDFVSRQVLIESFESLTVQSDLVEKCTIVEESSTEGSPKNSAVKIVEENGEISPTEESPKQQKPSKKISIEIIKGIEPESSASGERVSPVVSEREDDYEDTNEKEDAIRRFVAKAIEEGESDSTMDATVKINIGKRIKIDQSNSDADVANDEKNDKSNSDDTDLEKTRPIKKITGKGSAEKLLEQDAKKIESKKPISPKRTSKNEKGEDDKTDKIQPIRRTRSRHVSERNKESESETSTVKDSPDNRKRGKQPARKSNEESETENTTVEESPKKSRKAGKRAAKSDKESETGSTTVDESPELRRKAGKRASNKSGDDSEQESTRTSRKLRRRGTTENLNKQNENKKKKVFNMSPPWPKAGKRTARSTLENGEIEHASGEETSPTVKSGKKSSHKETNDEPSEVPKSLRRAKSQNTVAEPQKKSGLRPTRSTKQNEETSNKSSPKVEKSKNLRSAKGSEEENETNKAAPKTTSKSKNLRSAKGSEEENETNKAAPKTTSKRSHANSENSDTELSGSKTSTKLRKTSKRTKSKTLQDSEIESSAVEESPVKRKAGRRLFNETLDSTTASSASVIEETPPKRKSKKSLDDSGFDIIPETPPSADSSSLSSPEKSSHKLSPSKSRPKLSYVPLAFRTRLQTTRPARIKKPKVFD